MHTRADATRTEERAACLEAKVKSLEAARDADREAARDGSRRAANLEASLQVVQQQHAALSAEMEGLAAQLDSRTRRVIELEATGSEAQTALRQQLLEARAAAEAAGREG